MNVRGTRRIIWGTVGVLWFLWIGYEDRGLTPVLILAALISLATGFEWVMSGRGNPANTIIIPLKGLTMGGLVPLTAIVLVLLKTSLHQHEIPDFSNEDIHLLFQRVPYWAAGGLLFALGVAVWEGIQNRLQ